MFDPNPSLEAVELKDGYQIFHDIWSFTERVKSKAITPQLLKVIRKNLDACLLGKAERWYTFETDAVYKSGLRNNPDSCTLWCKALESRFREAPGVSLSRLKSLQYTIRNAHNRCDPEDFISQIITNRKNSGLATTEAQQILLAYKYFNAEFQRDLPVCNEAFTMSDFMKHITVQKLIWFDLFASNHYGDYQSSNRRTNRGGYNFDTRAPFQPLSSAQYQGRSGPYMYGRDFRREPGPQFQSQSQSPFQQNDRDRSNNPQAPDQKPAIKQESGRYGAPDQKPAIKQESGRYGAPVPGPPKNQDVRYNRSRDGRPRNNRNQFQNQNLPFRPRNYHYSEGPEDPVDEQNNYQTYEDNYYQNNSFQDDADPHVEDGYYSLEEHQDNGMADDLVEAHFSVNSHPKFICKRCSTNFDSNNQLHRHLKARRCTTKPVPESRTHCNPTFESPSPPSSIVRSTAVNPPSTQPGYSFCGWRYTTVEAYIGSMEGPTTSICLDTGCTMSLVDRSFLKDRCPQIKIHTMSSPMEVRGIGLTSHSANVYARVDFYLPGKDGRTAYFQREVHLVENLKANLLMGIDIISPEQIHINTSREVAMVRLCDNIELALSIQTRSANVQRTVFSQKGTRIPAHTRKALPIHGAKGTSLSLPQDCDLLFEPSVKQKVSVFAHIVNHCMEAIYVQNDSDSDVVLPRNTRIGNVVEYEADGCFLASVSDSEIALKPAKKLRTTGWIRRAWKGMLAAAATTAAYRITTDGPNDITTHLESKLSNRATGYGDQPTIKAFNKAVNNYPNLWVDHGNTAKVPESEWMEIPLVDNWMELYKPGHAHVYPVGQKDWEVIDSAFDKLHEQGRMEWTTEATPFTYPCFVVWKNFPDGRKKGCVVVDIRALNKITLPDAYPVPSQSDILSAVSGASYITTVDCCSFFYHWLVKPEH